MTPSISPDKLKNIHKAAIIAGGIDEISLIDTIRDEATLFYIAERSNYIDGEYRRSAWIMWSIANYHPFMEGNKRTALLSGEIVLDNEFINVDDASMDIYIRNMASGNINEEELYEWIKSHAKCLDEYDNEHIEILVKIHKEALKLLSI